jgi:hypothetical protein
MLVIIDKSETCLKVEFDIILPYKMTAEAGL